MFFLLTYPIAALPVVGLLFVFVRYLKSTSLSVRTKRITFGGVAIFCLYPTILPAGTVFGFIVPNLILLLLNLVFSDLGNFIVWNIKIFPSLAPFIFITICVIIRVTLGLFKEENTAKDIGIDTDIGTITDMNEDELY